MNKKTSRVMKLFALCYENIECLAKLGCSTFIHFVFKGKQVFSLLALAQLCLLSELLVNHFNSNSKENKDGKGKDHLLDTTRFDWL